MNVRNRDCILGGIKEGQMHLWDPGEIVDRCWKELPDAFPGISLDVYQIMPDHFHGIVVIWGMEGDLISEGDLINQIAGTNNQIAGTDNQISAINIQLPRTGKNPPMGLDPHRFGPIPPWQQMKNQKQTLGKIIRHFKAKTSKKIHDAGFDEFRWQSGYFDRIIRNTTQLDRTRRYIRNNPMKWRISKY